MMKLALKKQKPLHWTHHSQSKMRYYRLSEARVKRVLRTPFRIEEGIVPKTVAYMQLAGSVKHPSEIWAMVLDEPQRRNVITAWRYPGKSPVRNPVPFAILQEVSEFIRADREA
ncbi:MAG: hypothetical protein A2128_00660 [Candidatus Liptonbacteria bacterium GWC1_60_9]|uniref:Uncharacterized protein n=3 Tax=Candidatus Liptoniibacteriota TaxID=1817909 RepID=A0A1G2CKY0_9BACT|nr:MAG: hypothetical protein A2128_00660 [Candidatus Liptonbacteria bacterium GWC1_60_9]OGY98483.1 MAG: hypothetical protein A3E09_01965 [Candidatus Liptonbacteria bacterium RIFCSPHIGHO2_12_FULL_60_13]OGZ02054.1 MAG: hypothetical protein A3G64_02670 [Candidatus Liptonbacteria bacterium RIFCSPLOWO2_12_FULL_60_15]